MRTTEPPASCRLGCFSRRVMVSSVCVFVCVDMKRDKPSTLRFSHAARRLSKSGTETKGSKTFSAFLTSEPRRRLDARVRQMELLYVSHHIHFEGNQKV